MLQWGESDIYVFPCSTWKLLTVCFGGFHGYTESLNCTSIQHHLSILTQKEEGQMMFLHMYSKCRKIFLGRAGRIWKASTTWYCLQNANGIWLNCASLWMWGYCVAWGVQWRWKCPHLFLRTPWQWERQTDHYSSVHHCVHGTSECPSGLRWTCT